MAKPTNEKLWSASKRKAIALHGGRFSARAMQTAVLIYKRAGGRYEGRKTGREPLARWTREDWQTRPGTNPIAQRLDGRTSRYLPASSWSKLTSAQQRATDRKKLSSGSGQHWVANTIAARKARRHRAGLVDGCRDLWRRFLISEIAAQSEMSASEVVMLAESPDADVAYARGQEPEDVAEVFVSTYGRAGNRRK